MTENKTPTVPKDFDEVLRGLPSSEKRRRAREIVEGARAFPAWKIRRVLGTNGGGELPAVERLEKARREGLFKLVADEKDKLLKQSLINDLTFALGADVDDVEAEVRAAGGEDLGKRLDDVLEKAMLFSDGKAQPGPKLWREQAEEVWEWFAARGGRFFFDAEAARPLIFYQNDIHLVTVSNPVLMGRLWALARFNREDRATKWILAELEHRAAAEGVWVHQHSWAHTDKAKRAVFLNMAAADGSIIKLHEGKVTTLPNGCNDDEVLLKKPHFMSPFTYVEDESGDAEALRMLGELVFRNMATSRTDALMAICWALCSFLLGFTSLRPNVHFQGPQGSGKTEAAKLLWVLLYGSEKFQGRFTLAALKASGAQAPFVIMDDITAGEMRDALLQHLKATATGMGSTKRMAGTEGGIVENPPASLIAITGIHPFEPSDLRERIFDVIASKAYQRSDWVEALTMMEILNWRDRILSAVFRTLARDVIPKFEEQLAIVKWLKGRFPKWAKTRMDEFTAMMVMVARRIAGPMGATPEGEDVDEALFGSVAARVFRQTGEFAADTRDEGVIAEFIKKQNEMSKEFDVESSPTLFWLEAVFRYLAGQGEDKVIGEKIVDRELGLTAVITREAADDEMWRGLRITASAAEMLGAISTLAKQRGLQGSLPFKSPLSLSKSVGNDKEMLWEAGLDVAHGVTKTGSGTRKNLYMMRIEKIEQGEEFAF